jgi:hypothetical protein
MSTHPESIVRASLARSASRGAELAAHAAAQGGRRSPVSTADDGLPRSPVGDRSVGYMPEDSARNANRHRPPWGATRPRPGCSGAEVATITTASIETEQSTHNR